jgi:3-deoxy-D-manno-octulosonate 8-phosphate phosphatase (KDO 8-P phosphatase)
LKYKNLVTDVDGVLTDGGFYYNTKGKVLKKFGPHDSDGFKILKSLGLSLQAISADKRGFPITEKRLNDMGIPISHVTEVDRFCWVENRFDLSKTIFVGDGYHDIKLLNECVLGIAPSNSPKIVKENANYVTDSCGGNGVILEIALYLENNL